MSYTLRTRKSVKYYDNSPLPRAIKTKPVDNKIYSIEVIDTKDDKVLIHYVGYDRKYDEWRSKEEIIKPRLEKTLQKEDVYRPFSFYDELGYQIKLALDSKRRKEPDVRIEMPFDRLVFDGGLKQHGNFIGNFHGHEVFSVLQYSCLDSLLGEGWWYRCLNHLLNFCYVNKDSIRFHIHNRISVKHYNPERKEMEEISGGYSFIFKFVRMDGCATEWETITGRSQFEH